jgi:hypothetical protein
MKTNLTFGKKFHAAILATLLGAGAYLCQAAPKPPPSPVLTSGATAWDCILNGQNGQQGIVFINFTTNTDIYGNYIFDLMSIETKVAAGNSSSSGRGGSSGRGTSLPPTRPATTNLFGLLGISGAWSYDVHGNTLGFYNEIILLSQSASATNYLTNAVSFKVKATPNQRITGVYASTVTGTGAFQGIPLRPVTDLTGHWTGKEIINGIFQNEFFTLSKTGFTNVYDIIGEGPGYMLEGTCMVSSQKKIAFANDKWITPTNAIVRATIAPLINNSTLLGGNTRGLNGNTSVNATNAQYNAFWVSP